MALAPWPRPVQESQEESSSTESSSSAEEEGVMSQGPRAPGRVETWVHHG